MNKRQGYFKSKLETREDENNSRYIEGYFVVYEQETKLWDRYFEKIAVNPFEDSLINNNIRCLYNHDSSVVLGCTKNNTLEIKSDEYGLWGRVLINPKDSVASDVYARVSRGDITGCSFGFNPIKEDFAEQENGLHVAVTKADIIEVSICTFPAYPQTEIHARQKEHENIIISLIEKRRSQLKEKLGEIIC